MLSLDIMDVNRREPDGLFGLTPLMTSYKLLSHGEGRATNNDIFNRKLDFGFINTAHFALSTWSVFFQA